VGIIQHIKAKHGEDALKDERGKLVLEELELKKDEDHIDRYSYIPKFMRKVSVAK
jgi:hypothetical protein